VATKRKECRAGMRRGLWKHVSRGLVLMLGLLLCGSVGVALAQSDAAPTKAELAAGEQLYRKRCMHCHGEAGDGQGVSAPFVYPKPRDFTSGLFKFRTHHENANGYRLASDEDIFRSIADGLHGTSMPSWREFFTSQQIRQLVHYIKTFSDVYQEEQPGSKLDFSGEIPSSPESIAKGKELFEGDFDCVSCHGPAGRGNGPQALEGLEDDWGERIWPADLTRPWTYRGGHRRQDIFRNINLGINGTPMPAFADPDPMADASLTDDPEEKKMIEEVAHELRQQIWHTVNYVQSLWTSPEEPQVKAVLSATRVTGALPVNPDDPAWKEVPVNYYPVVGQVTEAPRLFTPMIVGVEVQAMHNEENIAFRLVWDDRTQSKPGKTDETESYADAIALQFPSHPLKGTEKPYFLMGDAEHPTDLWYWRNDTNTVVRVQTTGYKTFQPGEASGGIKGSGVFDNGQYRLVMTRALHTGQADEETQFTVGAFLPISLTVWDGSNGEHGGGKRTVTAWYNLYLESEPSKAPIYLLVVGIAVGLVVEFSALYVTRKNHGQGNMVSETGES
jgi:DMSO reductase family type II enzyme heme b subunit